MEVQEDLHFYYGAVNYISTWGWNGSFTPIVPNCSGSSPMTASVTILEISGGNLANGQTVDLWIDDYYINI